MGFKTPCHNPFPKNWQVRVHPLPNYSHLETPLHLSTPTPQIKTNNLPSKKDYQSIKAVPNNTLLLEFHVPDFF